MATKNYQRIGEVTFSRMEKVNAELFTLTYGAVVTQLIKDYENIDEVNKQLDKMGYNIGCRCIDEYFAKSNAGRCNDFKDAAEALSKVGFKMFLGINARVQSFNADNTEFSVVLDENPLADFVELPDHLLRSNLSFSNIISGVIRGAFEMVSSNTLTMQYFPHARVCM
eukprot:TRINITY_DN6995_c0_g1_i1.p1 TRINITY_DN6995_c0_g1~~TRINITY_DN6995_c0_g1_i1.p1  ORF type:complete len:168 (-),score=26.45 TRINITY_DN6995_c0_g1_i1:61-564(-)